MKAPAVAGAKAVWWVPEETDVICAAMKAPAVAGAKPTRWATSPCRS